MDLRDKILVFKEAITQKVQLILTEVIKIGAFPRVIQKSLKEKHYFSDLYVSFQNYSHNGNSSNS